MIQSTSLSDRSTQPEAVAPVPPRSAPVSTPKSDRLSLSSQQHLQKALAQNPEIRPEVLDRARELANDPTYPSIDILRQVSARIVGSPDLAEQID